MAFDDAHQLVQYKIKNAVFRRALLAASNLNILMTKSLDGTITVETTAELAKLLANSMAEINLYAQPQTIKAIGILCLEAVQGLATTMVTNNNIQSLNGQIQSERDQTEKAKLFTKKAEMIRDELNLIVTRQKKISELSGLALLEMRKELYVETDEEAFSSAWTETTAYAEQFFQKMKSFIDDEMKKTAENQTSTPNPNTGLW